MDWKRVLCLAAALALSAVLSGCMFNASPEDLYELPQLPEEYTALREMIDEILAGGAEYAAPASGTNVQSVQLVDLNGDGVEEALAFFRNQTEERPLKVYIFQAVEDGYRQAALIEGSGTAIHSISYIDMNGDGVQELVVGWRVSAEMQAVGVYNIKGYNPQTVMFSPYVRYEILDFNGDGMQEMVLFHSDANGTPVAEYYGWVGPNLEAASTATLSMTMAELSSVDPGKLREGETALFVTGVSEDTRAITDILVYREGEGMANIVRSDYTGVSSEIFRNIALEPTDIDGDGATEVPMPVVLPSATGSVEELYWQVYWRNYDSRGRAEIAVSTYHNTADGWYLILPDSWEGQIAVRQIAGTDEKETIFSRYDPEKDQYVDFMGIFTITGRSRESQAARGGRFVLKRQADTVYAAVFYPGGDGWREMMDQEELNQRFRLVVREWFHEDN